MGPREREEEHRDLGWGRQRDSILQRDPGKGGPPSLFTLSANGWALLF